MESKDTQITQFHQIIQELNSFDPTTYTDRQAQLKAYQFYHHNFENILTKQSIKDNFNIETMQPEPQLITIQRGIYAFLNTDHLLEFHCSQIRWATYNTDDCCPPSLSYYMKHSGLTRGLIQEIGQDLEQHISIIKRIRIAKYEEHHKDEYQWLFAHQDRHPHAVLITAWMNFTMRCLDMLRKNLPKGPDDHQLKPAVGKEGHDTSEQHKGPATHGSSGNENLKVVI